MRKRLLFLFFILLNVSFVFSQDLLMQNGTFNQCSGTLYDSGGDAGNYANNENFVLTICPENAGDFIHLNFTLFESQANADILTIYDGDDTTATVLGTFSGQGVNPGAFQGSTASGCLTLEWVSNAAANINGFAAPLENQKLTPFPFFFRLTPLGLVCKLH